MTGVIVTIPPYAPFIREVARHPVVTGLRLNTVMPTKEPLDVLLKRLQDFSYGKNIFVDLKGRQLRTTGFGVPPFTEINISHDISVNTPVTAYFCNGEESATVVGIDGRRLLFLEGPRRVVGPGESINITDPSLVINGYLTDKDISYIEAAKKIGLHDYMLSFVESNDDLSEVRNYDSNANIVAKIESIKGLKYVREDFKKDCHLMAARGDLYIELKRPHDILDAVETIVQADSEAIVASRLLNSMNLSTEPSCQDISDVAYLIKSGYHNLMLGDEVCMRRESVMGSLNLLESIIEYYDKNNI